MPGTLRWHENADCMVGRQQRADGSGQSLWPSGQVPRSWWSLSSAQSLPWASLHARLSLGMEGACVSSTTVPPNIGKALGMSPWRYSRWASHTPLYPSLQVQARRAGSTGRGPPELGDGDGRKPDPTEPATTHPKPVVPAACTADPQGLHPCSWVVLGRSCCSKKVRPALRPGLAA